MLSKKRMFALALMAASSAALPTQAEAGGGGGGAASAADNPWLEANNAYVAMSVAATTGGVSRVEKLGVPAVRLASAEAGFPLERAKPDYYLADEIEPPDGVDWAATYQNFLSLAPDAQSKFIFDEDAHRVFAAQGGTYVFTWVPASTGRTIRTTAPASTSPAGS